MTFPTARKTARTAEPEFGPALPIYAGPRLPDGDNRVQLDDGRVCFAWNDTTGNEPYLILCTELVALDAGDNVVRRRKAASQSSAGITAPGGGRLVSVPADGAAVGYYLETA